MQRYCLAITPFFAFYRHKNQASKKQRSSSGISIECLNHRPLEMGMSVFKGLFTLLMGLLFAACSHAGDVLQDINGQKIPFDDLRGKWVLINYWASWCPPCLEEISELNRFYAKNKAVALFAVNYESLPTHMQQRLIKQFDIHYPSLKKDPAGALHLDNIRGIPATFVFNPQGELIDTLYGAQTVASLKEALTVN